MSLYHVLHAAIHAKGAHLKVHHRIRRDTVSLAWSTPTFELYCVAANLPPNSPTSGITGGTSNIDTVDTGAGSAIGIDGGDGDVKPRNKSGDDDDGRNDAGQAIKAALVQAANQVVQWIAKEEERLFIIGGAVSSSWNPFHPSHEPRFLAPLSSFSCPVSLILSFF